MRISLLFSKWIYVPGLFIFASVITSTVNSETTSPQALDRWYSQQQVGRGKPLYRANCASCHLIDASGQEINSIIVPALNGSAHTWHHPLSSLQRTIRTGGVSIGGIMPGFAGKLSEQDIDDILAWVQSHWSDEIYSTWARHDAKSRNKP